MPSDLAIQVPFPIPGHLLGPVPVDGMTLDQSKEIRREWVRLRSAGRRLVAAKQLTKDRYDRILTPPPALVRAAYSLGNRNRPNLTPEAARRGAVAMKAARAGGIPNRKIEARLVGYIPPVWATVYLRTASHYQGESVRSWVTAHIEVRHPTEPSLLIRYKASAKGNGAFVQCVFSRGSKRDQEARKHIHAWRRVTPAELGSLPAAIRDFLSRVSFGHTER